MGSSHGLRPANPSASPDQPTRDALQLRAKKLWAWQQKRIQMLEAAIQQQLDQLDKLAVPETGKGPVATEESKALRLQLAQARKLLNSRAEELKQLRAELASQSSKEGDAEKTLQELFALRSEREQLLLRLSEAERQLEQAAAVDTRAFDELQSRFELAVQEIRELKAQNEQLEKRPAAQQSRMDSGSFSWEQQKERLMRELEGFDQSDTQQAADKLTVEGAIRLTDQVVAEKEREIADLRQRLDQAETGRERGAPPPDFDLLREEAIRVEHERLQQLQEEWRAKLREAEVEVSVQRAKLARERLELEEQRRALEQQRAELPSAPAKSSNPVKGSSGRWLSRLGLKDCD